ncbi:MAG: hypothetical protein ABSG67_15745 [Thermoguttaceae bacterium]
MNIQKISKQIKHEIAAHPKKAIVLGIMMVVGLFIWIPHVLGWLNKSEEGPKSSGTQVAVNMSPGQTNSANNLSANKENKPLQYSWKEVLKWMNNDPRTRPAQQLTIDRDPFQGSKEATDETKEEAEAKAPPVSPASLGMALTSTIIGPNGGIARIGGRTYNQGQTIEAVKEGRNYKFVLTEIHDRKVVLELEGESFELSIPEPGTSGRMVLGTIEKQETGR